MNHFKVIAYFTLFTIFLNVNVFCHPAQNQLDSVSAVNPLKVGDFDRFNAEASQPEEDVVKPDSPESVDQEQANQEQVSQEPAKPEPVNQEPVNQEPIKQEVVKQEPVKQEPVKQEPVKQEVVKQEVVKQEAIKQEIPKSDLHTETLREGEEHERIHGGVCCGGSGKPDYTKAIAISAKGHKIAAIASGVVAAPIVIKSAKTAAIAALIPVKLAAKGAIIGGLIAKPIIIKSAIVGATAAKLSHIFIGKPIAAGANLLAGIETLRAKFSSKKVECVKPECA